MHDTCYSYVTIAWVINEFESTKTMLENVVNRNRFLIARYLTRQKRMMKKATERIILGAENIEEMKETAIIREKVSTVKVKGLDSIKWKEKGSSKGHMFLDN